MVLQRASPVHCCVAQLRGLPVRWSAAAVRPATAMPTAHSSSATWFTDQAFHVQLRPTVIRLAVVGISTAAAKLLASCSTRLPARGPSSRDAISGPPGDIGTMTPASRIRSIPPAVRRALSSRDSTLARGAHRLRPCADGDDGVMGFGRYPPGGGTCGRGLESVVGRLGQRFPVGMRRRCGVSAVCPTNTARSSPPAADDPVL